MKPVNRYAANIITGLTLILALMSGPAVAAEPAAGGSPLAETIQYLLDFVKDSQCIFIRNNKAHNAGEAADHIQRKYEHFRDQIQTPEDFIQLTATKSLMTGEPYYVRLKDGKKITSEAWLLKALEDYRQKPK